MGWALVILGLLFGGSLLLLRESSIVIRLIFTILALWLIPHGYYILSHKNSAETGSGGQGGKAKALDGAAAMGGNGGLGGGAGGGKGGKGGDAEAFGRGSLAIGGDGGGGYRADGRGGKGADSLLKKLPPDMLKQFGLTGNENYGSGGDGGNSQEYVRRIGILKVLNSEYSKENPGLKLHTMQGVEMPPVEWINKRLSQKKESFRVDFIKNDTDFFLRSVDVGNK